MVNLTVMDTLLRSHLLISFPQVGGRATELPSPGRRSGDALQPLQEQTHVQTGFHLLAEREMIYRACQEPKMQLPDPHRAVHRPASCSKS